MRKGHVLFLLLLFFSVILLQAENAVLLESYGDVRISSSGQSVSAVTGQDLESGDVITTGDDGKALILLSDGTRIELVSNSRLELRKREQDHTGRKSSLLGELWQSIKGKFADAEYSSAQAGGVGALRAFGDDEEIVNDELSLPLEEELEGNVQTIDDERLPRYTSYMMKGILYELYGQFAEAESMYLSMVEVNPGDPVSYDMLIDLYMKIDCYNHAKEISAMKSEIFKD